MKILRVLWVVLFAAVPVTAFYDGPDPPRHYARFAFCKQDAVLDEAVARLAAHFARPRAGRA